MRTKKEPCGPSDLQIPKPFAELATLTTVTWESLVVVVGGGDLRACPSGMPTYALKLQVWTGSGTGSRQILNK